MTRTLPTNEEAADIRSFLGAHGYSFEELCDRVGRAAPPDRDSEQAMLDATREINLQNLLVRLFLLGYPLDSGIIEEFVPPDMSALLLRLGMLETSGGKTRSAVVIVAIDEMLFASDAFFVLGTDSAAEFVLPASTHSGNFLRRMMLAAPVTRTLDLGCGCGLHAMFAAKISDKVIATDISEAALYFTQLNALLNGLPNIETRRGSLFEPVSDEQFDWIISNPPFVIAPGKTFVYRDNEMPLDSFCERLVRDSTTHLTNDGYLQMLCEWAETDEEDWSTRVASWIRGCDAWVVHSTPVSAADYVRQRSADIDGEGALASDAALWLEHLHEHRVTAVHPGLLNLRRRDGDNWMKIFDITEDDSELSGHAISNGFAAIDFLQLCDDDSLRSAVLIRSRRVSATSSVGKDIEAFIEFYDGTRDVRQCIALVLKQLGTQDDGLTTELLETTRTLVENGYLAPAETE